LKSQFLDCLSLKDTLLLSHVLVSLEIVVLCLQCRSLKWQVTLLSYAQAGILTTELPTKN